MKEDRVHVDGDGEVLIRVVAKTATFGLIARHGRIVRAAPTAKWTVGKSVDEVIAHFKQRRATVETL